jgi:hypothetical protein
LVPRDRAAGARRQNDESHEKAGLSAVDGGAVTIAAGIAGARFVHSERRSNRAAVSALGRSKARPPRIFVGARVEVSVSDARFLLLGLDTALAFREGPEAAAPFVVEEQQRAGSRALHGTTAQIRPLR